VWADLSLGESLLDLGRRVWEVLMLGRLRPMFPEDSERKDLTYTRHWYQWRNFLCFWDDTRSLLGKTISVYYKNQQAAPYILDHNGQLECWNLHSLAQVEAFLRAVENEKKRE